MSIGMVLLTVVAVLVFFGVAQRVLDKLYLSDRAALILIALMFFGRVGGLTLIFAALAGKRPCASKLPREKITVG